jgi:hypothetical protein
VPDGGSGAAGAESFDWPWDGPASHGRGGSHTRHGGYGGVSNRSAPRVPGLVRSERASLRAAPLSRQGMGQGMGRAASQPLKVKRCPRPPPPKRRSALHADPLPVPPGPERQGKDAPAAASAGCPAPNDPSRGVHARPRCWCLWNYGGNCGPWHDHGMVMGCGLCGCGASAEAGLTFGANGGKEGARGGAKAPQTKAATIPCIE